MAGTATSAGDGRRRTAGRPVVGARACRRRGVVVVHGSSTLARTTRGRTDGPAGVGHGSSRTTGRATADPGACGRWGARGPRRGRRVGAARPLGDQVVLVGTSMGGVVVLNHLASASGGVYDSGAQGPWSVSTPALAGTALVARAPWRWYDPTGHSGVWRPRADPPWPSGRPVERVEPICLVARPVSGSPRLADRFVPPVPPGRCSRRSWLPRSTWSRDRSRFLPAAAWSVDPAMPG